MNKKISVVLLALAAGCATPIPEDPSRPPMDPRRKVSEQDCSRPFDTDGGNLKCREVTDAELRARAAEADRQARARREAEERAARERLERERAEQLAREEAARRARAAEEERLAKLRAAEEERLAAERRRLEAEAEAARKAQEERERKEREEAEARARQLAEQQAREAAAREAAAREAAARECRRLAQEGSEGRALLSNFVASYGKVEEFRDIGGEISAFLAKARDAKPCPN